MSHNKRSCPLLLLITSPLLLLITVCCCPIGCQIVLSSDQLLANATSFVPPPQMQRHFWVSTVVEQVHLRKECISAQLCAEPRFSLINQMPKFNERLSRDWALTKAEVPGIPLDFFTFWSRGMPSDVTIQAFVHGIDPKFKFSRICDESSVVSVFQFVAKPNDHQQSNEEEEGEHNERIQLELHAHCFNATLTVELFRHRCPWCLIEHAQQQKASAHLMDTPPSLLCQLPLQFRTNLLIVLLAVATGINVLAFVGLLCICERQRRANDNGNNCTNYEREKQDRIRGNQKCPAQMVFPRVQQHYPPCAPSKNRHQAMRTQQLLPTISEEFYEVIDDEATEARPNVPLHFTHKPKCAFQKQTKMIQLPLSNKCDHCFLRLQGDDRCSCGSLDTSIESNFGNSFTEETDENLKEMPESSSNTSDKENSDSSNAIDSGLDGSNHTDEEKT